MRHVSRIGARFAGTAGSLMGLMAAFALLSMLVARQAAAAEDAAVTTPASSPSSAPALDDTPTSVMWTLDVLRDGQTIDQFQGTTMVGQAFSATHHHRVTHRVGCKENPAGGIDLARTVSVSPVAADVAGVTLAIETDETIEDDTAPATPEGCKLPPQPRRLNASHPGLHVPVGGSADWTLIDKNPTLIYRVHASVSPH
jgi:hypothetical protein